MAYVQEYRCRLLLKGKWNSTNLSCTLLLEGQWNSTNLSMYIAGCIDVTHVCVKSEQRKAPHALPFGNVVISTRSEANASLSAG